MQKGLRYGNSDQFRQYSSGIITSDVIVSSGGSQIISFGGVANNTIVSSGGYLGTQGTGIAKNVTIYAGGNVDGMYVTSGKVSGVVASGGVVKAGGWIQLRGGSKLDGVTINSGGILTMTADSNQATALTANGANIAFDITGVTESSTAMMLDADSTSKVTANYSIVATDNQALGTYELTDLDMAAGTQFSIKIAQNTIRVAVDGSAVTLNDQTYQLTTNAATGQVNLVIADAAAMAQQLATGDVADGILYGDQSAFSGYLNATTVDAAQQLSTNTNTQKQPTLLAVA